MESREQHSQSTRFLRVKATFVAILTWLLLLLLLYTLFPVLFGWGWVPPALLLVGIPFLYAAHKYILIKYSRFLSSPPDPPPQTWTLKDYIRLAIFENYRVLGPINPVIALIILIMVVFFFLFFIIGILNLK